MKATAQETNYSDLFQSFGQPMEYHPSLAKLAASVHGGILLGCFINWQNGEAGNDGWICKTQAEIKSETGLSYHEQKTARRRLKEKGFLQEKRAGIPSKVYYRPCLEKIIEKLSEMARDQEPNYSAAVAL